MQIQGDIKTLSTMPNEDLIDLLFSEEDRLPRAAADEIIRRGNEISPFLYEIMSDKILWTADVPEYWAVVHATYLAGAIGGEISILPLLSALRWADAFDNTWVTEDLPAIFAHVGKITYPFLLAAASDLSAGWSARSIAMDALGSIALKFPEMEEHVVAFLGKILSTKAEDFGARRSAAFVLLDFRRADYKKQLIGFAMAEENMRKQYPEYKIAFSVDDVERDLSTPRCEMDLYLHDWLKFYDPEEIQRRKLTSGKEGRRDESLKDSRPTLSSVVINPNDACPCGSNKPYKRCCWRKLH